jgi:hypothetical protein
MQPTLGSLARFQAFFYASAFFQSDGVPPPAPARVPRKERAGLTQTVGRSWNVFNLRSWARFSKSQRAVLTELRDKIQSLYNNAHSP